MQATVVLPDRLAEEATALAGIKGLSQLIVEAVQLYVQQLQTQQLSRLMAEGYAAEAEKPSLDADWSATELDAWA
jgi:hypothetical protein